MMKQRAGLKMALLREHVGKMCLLTGPALSVMHARMILKWWRFDVCNQVFKRMPIFTGQSMPDAGLLRRWPSITTDDDNANSAGRYYRHGD